MFPKWNVLLFLQGCSCISKVLEKHLWKDLSLPSAKILKQILQTRFSIFVLPSINMQLFSNINTPPWMLLTFCSEITDLKLQNTLLFHVSFLLPITISHYENICQSGHTQKYLACFALKMVFPLISFGFTSFDTPINLFWLMSDLFQ